MSSTGGRTESSLVAKVCRPGRSPIGPRWVASAEPADGYDKAQTVSSRRVGRRRGCGRSPTCPAIPQRSAPLRPRSSPSHCPHERLVRPRLRSHRPPARSDRESCNRSDRGDHGRDRPGGPARGRGARRPERHPPLDGDASGDPRPRRGRARRPAADTPASASATSPRRRGFAERGRSRDGRDAAAARLTRLGSGGGLAHMLVRDEPHPHFAERPSTIVLILEVDVPLLARHPPS